MKNFFSELIERLKTSSPKFFVKLRWVAAIVVILIGAAQQAEEMNLIAIPETWDSTLADVLLVLTGIFGTTFLPKKSSTENGDDPAEGGPGPGGEPTKPPVKP